VIREIKDVKAKKGPKDQQLAIMNNSANDSRDQQQIKAKLNIFDE
jgi:hypothetical protein